MSYTPGGVDAISRLREIIADTAETIVDARLQRWLDDTLSQEQLLIRLPTGTDGATGATVTIAMDGADLKMTLQRTMSPSEAASVLVLAPLPVSPAVRAPKIADVIDWIGSLEQGWQVAVQIGRDTEWIDPESTSWSAALKATGRLPRHAPSINLAENGGAATAYGDEKDAAELRFLQLYSAALRAIAPQDIGTVDRQTDGAMTRTYRGVTDVLGHGIRQQANKGLYAV